MRRSPLPRRRTIGSLKARYGLAPRRRYAEVMAVAKATYPCRRCGYTRVRRVSVGIWKCRKCGHTFAGGAYQPTTKMGEAAQRIGAGAPSASAATRQAAPVKG